MSETSSIIRLHADLNTLWHLPPDSEAHPSPAPAPPNFHTLVTAHHRENFELWHEEDKARVPDASDAEIAEVKHAIDRFNQRRNDLVEKMDEWLINNLPPQNPAASLHSETPGLILDRLSILSLKIFHTHIEAHRDTATETHRLRNAARLAILEHQRDDLATCLDSLLTQVVEGSRRFQLYRQMKMYNDPELNPAVYTHSITHSKS
jgi:hypothetical protein